MDDLTINDDIPEAPDETLEGVVAEWLGDVCDAPPHWRTDLSYGKYSNIEYRTGVIRTKCWPKYTTDPAAAWRLERELVDDERVRFESGEIVVVVRDEGPGPPQKSALYDWTKRGVVEAAAHIAILEDDCG